MSISSESLSVTVQRASEREPVFIDGPTTVEEVLDSVALDITGNETITIDGQVVGMSHEVEGGETIMVTPKAAEGGTN